MKKQLLPNPPAEVIIDMGLCDASGEVPIPDATPEEELLDALQDYHTTRFFAAAREHAPRIGRSDEWGRNDE